MLAAILAMSLFAGLPLGHLDQVALAVHDILHSDAWIRDAFGGRTLAGTASITPGTKNLAGTATSWASEVGPGDRLLLGYQVARIATVDADDALTIDVDHGLGLDNETIHVAARGFRIDRPDAPLGVAPPHWTVGAGIIQDLSPGIGRLISTPSVLVAFHYVASPHPLADDTGSWAALVQRVALRFKEADGARLTVPRFDGQPLARGPSSPFVGAGTAVLVDADGSPVYRPAMQMTWEGADPAAAVLYTQRW